MSHKPKLFDTHTHAYYPPLSDMADEVVEKMRTNNVMKAVQIGTNVEHSREAIDLAKRFPGEYYATVGLHPTDAQDIDFESDLGIQTRNELTQLIGENNWIVVAVGETGFDDFHSDQKDFNRRKMQLANQEKWFRWHLEIAKKYNLCTVIHTRNYPEETVRMLQEMTPKRAIIHCCSENKDFAKSLLDIQGSDICFGFTGILTYPKSDIVRETAQFLPLNAILIETDAPWLAPQSHRGQTNDSSLITKIFYKLSDLRPESLTQIEEALWKNSMRVYALK